MRSLRLNHIAKMVEELRSDKMAPELRNHRLTNEYKEPWQLTRIKGTLIIIERMQNKILILTFYFGDLCSRVTFIAFSFSFVVNLVTSRSVVPC